MKIQKSWQPQIAPRQQNRSHNTYYIYELAGIPYFDPVYESIGLMSKPCRDANHRHQHNRHWSLIWSCKLNTYTFRIKKLTMETLINFLYEIERRASKIQTQSLRYNTYWWSRLHITITLYKQIPKMLPVCTQRHGKLKTTWWHELLKYKSKGN